MGNKISIITDEGIKTFNDSEFDNKIQLYVFNDSVQVYYGDKHVLCLDSNEMADKLIK